MNELTVHQKEFLKKHNGTKDPEKTKKLKKWLSQGEVTAQTYVNFKTHKTTLAPQSRGVRISDVFAKTEEAALAAGKKVLKEFKEETKDIDLDSKALLIDGLSYRQARDSEDLNIDSFIHLGISTHNGMNDHRLQDGLDDFVGDLIYAKEAFGRLKVLKKALEKSAKDNEDNEDISDLYIEAIQDAGFHGIALGVSTPVRKYYKTGSGCSYSWGHTYTGYVYGETFEEALDLAHKWVKKQHAYDKDRAKKKEDEKK